MRFTDILVRRSPFPSVSHTGFVLGAVPLHHLDGGDSRAGPLWLGLRFTSAGETARGDGTSPDDETDRKVPGSCRGRQLGVVPTRRLSRRMVLCWVMLVER